MNNKGFTLIELVATIGLLAVISIISYVSINKVLEESKISECEQLVMSIKSAAKEYVSDNRYSNTISLHYLGDEILASITGSKLVNGKYLTSPIINPCDKSEIAPNSIKVTVYLNEDYSVKDALVVAPNILNECKCE